MSDLYNKKWNKSIYYMTDREIAQYYCQIWDNIKHIKSYVLALRKRYQLEIGTTQFNKRGLSTYSGRTLNGIRRIKK